MQHNGGLKCRFSRPTINPLRSLRVATLLSCMEDRVTNLVGNVRTRNSGDLVLLERVER